MFLSWVGSDLRSAKAVPETERALLAYNGAKAKFVSLCLCTSCHLSLEKGLPHILFADSIGGAYFVVASRWLLAAVFFYNSLHMLDVIYRLPLLWAQGISVVETHDDPIGSQTLGEFWGKRWDKAVQMMLNDVVFSPVREAFGFVAAVWITFAASGLLHVYALLWAGCNWTLCAYMSCFFVAQPLLLQLERVVKVPWLPVLSVTTPLFLEPFLQVAGW